MNCENGLSVLLVRCLCTVATIASLAGSSTFAAPGDLIPDFPETTITGNVASFAVAANGEAYLSGDFTTFRGAETGKFIKLLRSGEVAPDFPLGNGFADERDREVFPIYLALDGAGSLYAAGDFSSYDGESRRGLARLSPAGVLDQSFAPELRAGGDVQVQNIEPFRDHLYIRGSIGLVADPGRTFSRLSRLDGQFDATFSPPLELLPSTFSAQIDGKVVALRQSYFYRFHPDGSLDDSVFAGPIVERDLNRMGPIKALPDGRILVFGEFTGQTLGEWRGQIRRFQNDGHVDASFPSGSTVKPCSNRDENMLVLDNGYIIAGGRLLLNENGQVVSDFVLGEIAEQDVIYFVRVDTRRLWLIWFDDDAGTLRLTVHELFPDTGIPNIEFAYDRFEASETATEIRAVIRRFGDYDSATTVSYQTVSGSAVSGEHYSEGTGSVTFAPGALTADIRIPLVNDDIPGLERSFEIQLVNGNGASLGARTTTHAAILDDDKFGVFSLILPEFATELGFSERGPSMVGISRSQGAEGEVTVSFEILPGTADARDFIVTSGSVTFAPGQTEAFIPVVVRDDVSAESIDDREMATIRLTGVSAGQLGGRSELPMLIGDDDAPGARLLLSETATAIRELALFPDGRIVGGGIGTPRFAIVRPDGTGDPASPRQQPNGTVLGVAVDHDGRALACGEFTAWGSSRPNRVARILADGTIDPEFVTTENGPNERVYRIVPLPDGRMLISGDFSKFGATDVAGIARILPDGTLDETFNSTALRGSDGTSPHIEELELTFDGKILAGSEEFKVEGISNRHLVRLNADGTIDRSFVVASDIVDAEIEAVLPMPDGSVIIGGDFVRTSGGTSAKHILKLLSDGSADLTFAPDGDANGPVREMRLLPNGQILVVGLFSRWQRQAPGTGVFLNPDGSYHSRFYGGGSNSNYAVVVGSDGLAYLGGNLGGKSRDIMQIRIDPAPGVVFQNLTDWVTYYFSNDANITPEFWSADPDADGASNIDEFIAGTAPTVDDRPLAPLATYSGNAVHLLIHGNFATRALTRTVEFSTDGTMWQALSPGDFQLEIGDNTGLFSIPLEGRMAASPTLLLRVRTKL